MAKLNDRQRAKRFVSQRNLGALANDTKWREFFAEIIARQVPLQIKLLDGPEVFQCPVVWLPSLNYIEGSGMGPYHFVFIEWIASTHSEEISGIARSIGLECLVEGSNATVYGYR